MHVIAWGGGERQFQTNFKQGFTLMSIQIILKLLQSYMVGDMCLYLQKSHFRLKHCGKYRGVSLQLHILISFLLDVSL